MVGAFVGLVAALEDGQHDAPEARVEIRHESKADQLFMWAAQHLAQVLVAVRDHQVLVEEDHADRRLLEQRPEAALGALLSAPGLLDVAGVDEQAKETLD